MSRQSKIVKLGLGEQSTRQMDRVERADRGREWFGRPFEHSRIQLDQIQGVYGLEHLGSMAGYIHISKSESDPGAVDRPQALKVDQLARNRVLDLGPDPKPPGFSEYNAQQDRRVDVDIQRSVRSSSSRSVELIFHPAAL